MIKFTRWLRMPAKPEPYAARKRFYKEVKIITNESNIQKTRTYSLAMDNRNLRSASGKIMELPSYPLALAAAAEWDQQHPNIHKSCMPLFSILNLCHDYDEKTKTKEGIIDEIVRYLQTDTLLYRDPAFDRPELAEIQEEKWGPATEKLMSMLDIEVGTTRRFYKKIMYFSI